MSDAHAAGMRRRDLLALIGTAAGGAVMFRAMTSLGCHMPGGVGAVGAGAYPALALNPNLTDPGYPLALVINGRNGMPASGQVTAADAQAARRPTDR